MTKALILSLAMVLLVSGSVLLGWVLNDWYHRPRYRRKTNR